MAETSLLAAGATASTSSTFTVAAGASVIVCMFASSGALSESALIDILMDISAGADVKFDTLSGREPAKTIYNQTGMTLTFKVQRPAQTDSVGAVYLA